ncbi:mCG1029387, isoform CRA_a [Mus musculus]|nr:mCG1029387, isoform CRA_a [Mus musculus]
MNIHVPGSRVQELWSSSAYLTTSAPGTSLKCKAGCQGGVCPVDASSFSVC